MARIFFGLALLALIILIYACLDGVLIGDYQNATVDFLDARNEMRSIGRKDVPESVLQEAQQRHEETLHQFRTVRSRVDWHMLLGIAASLVALLVNCLSVTYFIGTGRWCKEVCETYRLDASFFQQSDRIKKRSFPWSLGGILLLLGIVSTGPACDPLANLSSAGNWVAWHRWVSILAVVLMAAAFLRQIVFIRQHYEVIGKILEEVRIVRSARGLDVDEVPSAD